MCFSVTIKTSPKSPHEQAEVLVKYAWRRTGLKKALAGRPGQLGLPAGQVFFHTYLPTGWGQGKSSSD